MFTQEARKRSRTATTTIFRTQNSARMIQKNWRHMFRFNKTHQIVEKFLKEGPTSSRVKSIRSVFSLFILLFQCFTSMTPPSLHSSFESLVVYLREKHVISIAKKCLQRVHLLSTFRHGSPSRALSAENVNVRVFLAGFMIAYRPTHVFESMGALEHALLEATTPLLDAFEKICACIQKDKAFSEVPPELTKDFPTLLFEYLKRFKAWKGPDEAKLTCRIKHALVALYQAEEHLPADEPPDSKLKLEFRTQIERLRSKLEQIAGAEALAKFDSDRPASLGEGGPRASASTGGAYAALPGRMTNEQLAHEMILDPEFQLDESGGCTVDNPVFHRIRESFHAVSFVLLHSTFPHI